MRRPELLTYDLGRGARAFGTGRRGSRGAGACAPFNADVRRGDDGRAARLNRELSCGAPGPESSRLTVPRQAHGSRVCRTGEAFFMRPGAARASLPEGADALAADLPGARVSAADADCVPIPICVPARHAAAAVHSGRRAAAARIPEAALRAFSASCGTRPQDAEEAVGPGVSPGASGAGGEARGASRAAGFPMGEAARRRPAAGAGDGRKGEAEPRPVACRPGLAGRARRAARAEPRGPGVRVPPLRASLLRAAPESRSGRVLDGIFPTD